MKVLKYFSRQARKPSGLYGRFYMSRIFDKGNRVLNDLVLSTMDLTGNEDVLEIGFGTGAMLGRVADQLDRGRTLGVDFSPTMVSKATQRNRTHIRSGRMELRSGDFMETDFGDRRFDRIFSVNTLYFWPDARAGIARLAGLLTPTGRLTLAFQKKDDLKAMPLDRSVFRFFTVDEVRRMFLEDGKLDEIQVHVCRSNGPLGFCMTACRGGGVHGH